MTSEVERLQAADPNFLIEIAVGPPCPALIPQNEPGLRFGGQYVTGITKQFIFKKAHLSNDDFRIFSKEGQLLCVSHHAGKNPYDALDPLGVGYQSNRPEWKSLTWVTGYHGMPSFKIRPKTVSRHGRQNVVDAQGSAVHFSVGNKSRLSTMSVRHNMEVNVGESGDTVYEVEADLAGRTLQFKNTRGELVAIATKSTKALVMSAALGSGSELEVDVAVGVDWTAILACLMAIQQVGAHLVKDVFSNFVATPLVGKAQDAALEATGLDGLAGKVGQLTNHGVSEFSKYSSMYNQFFK